MSPDSRTLVVGPAPDAVVAQLFDPQRRASAKPYDVIVGFCPDHKTLDRLAATLPDRITVAGALWLCWYKRASGIATDIGEKDIHETGLATGLVDVKVAAIDDSWSGFKFVRRRRDR